MHYNSTVYTCSYTAFRSLLFQQLLYKKCPGAGQAAPFDLTRATFTPDPILKFKPARNPKPVSMPICMDRHDVSENVTAAIVALLHEEDLKIQGESDCRGLTYWFDDRRKTAFCLVEAPDKLAIQQMHNHAHGQVPHAIIEVDASLVESFSGRIEDPERAQNTDLNIINDPAFRTIPVTEVKRMKIIFSIVRIQFPKPCCAR